MDEMFALQPFWVRVSSSATLALLVEIKNPGRKGSKLPLWHMEDSDLGVNPTWTDFQEFCH